MRKQSDTLLHPKAKIWWPRESFLEETTLPDVCVSVALWFRTNDEKWSGWHNFSVYNDQSLLKRPGCLLRERFPTQRLFHGPQRISQLEAGRPNRTEQLHADFPDSIRAPINEKASSSHTWNRSSISVLRAPRSSHWLLGISNAVPIWNS